MQKQRTGFTLVELLIYIAVLTMAIGATIALIVSGTEVAARLKAVRDVRASATTSLDRMTREIFESYDVDEAGSTLGSSPGSIALLTRDDSGITHETEFRVENGSLVVYEGGMLKGSLTTDSVEVDSLIFRKASHGVTESVTIELTLSMRDVVPDRVDSFYTTVHLRGGY